MKKILLTIVAALVFAGLAVADDRPISFEQLPKAAQTFIKSNFAGVKVSYSTVDHDIMGNTYDVLLANGTEVEFNDKGEWKQIECKFSPLDEKFVPKQIKDYVVSNFEGVQYLGIERGRNGYEVKLTNGLELTFNKNFVLVDIDD